MHGGIRSGEDISCFVLTYGEHINLLRRCVESILPLLPLGVDLYLAANAPGAASLAYLRELVAAKIGQRGSLRVFCCDENIHKYPMMRHLFSVAGASRPWTMWFDDDSYLTNPSAAWLESLAAASTRADMLGHVHVIGWHGEQRAWVQRQPWYGNKPMHRKNIVFAAGGWWCVRTEILRRHRYPFAGLDHNGGDTMLGELIYQQGLKLVNWHQDVMVNRAPRRGYSSPPLGFRLDQKPVVVTSPIYTLEGEAPTTAVLPQSQSTPVILLDL